MPCQGQKQCVSAYDADQYFKGASINFIYTDNFFNIAKEDPLKLALVDNQYFITDATYGHKVNMFIHRSKLQQNTLTHKVEKSTFQIKDIETRSAVRSPGDPYLELYIRVDDIVLLNVS